MYVKKIIRYQLAESRIAYANSIHSVQRKQAESKMEIVPLRHSCGIIVLRLVNKSVDQSFYSFHKIIVYFIYILLFALWQNSYQLFSSSFNF